MVVSQILKAGARSLVSLPGVLVHFEFLAQLCRLRPPQVVVLQELLAVQVPLPRNLLRPDLVLQEILRTWPLHFEFK